MSARATAPENAGRKQDGRFARGVSGNARGKGKGVRNKVTLAVEALLEGEAEALTRKAVELALAGDLAALRMCLDRIAPVRRDRAVIFKMPAITAVSDHPSALTTIIRAVGEGELSPVEAQAISAVLAEHRKAVETVDIEARLAAIEQGNAHDR